MLLEPPAQGSEGAAAPEAGSRKSASAGNRSRQRNLPADKGWTVDDRGDVVGWSDSPSERIPERIGAMIEVGHFKREAVY